MKTINLSYSFKALVLFVFLFSCFSANSQQRSWENITPTQATEFYDSDGVVKTLPNGDVVVAYIEEAPSNNPPVMNIWDKTEQTWSGPIYMPGTHDASSVDMTTCQGAIFLGREDNNGDYVIHKYSTTSNSWLTTTASPFCNSCNSVASDTYFVKDMFGAADQANKIFFVGLDNGVRLFEFDGNGWTSFPLPSGTPFNIQDDIKGYVKSANQVNITYRYYNTTNNTTELGLLSWDGNQLIDKGLISTPNYPYGAAAYDVGGDRVDSTMAITWVKQDGSGSNPTKLKTGHINSSNPSIDNISVTNVSPNAVATSSFSSGSADSIFSLCADNNSIASGYPTYLNGKSTGSSNDAVIDNDLLTDFIVSYLDIDFDHNFRHRAYELILENAANNPNILVRTLNSHPTVVNPGALSGTVCTNITSDVTVLDNLAFKDADHDSIRVAAAGISISNPAGTGITPGHVSVVRKNSYNPLILQPQNFKVDIDPQGLTQGQTGIQLEFTDGFDTLTKNIPITVANGGVTATFSDTTLCSSTSLVNISSLASPSGGTFSGPGIQNNQFYPGLINQGSNQITYTYSNTNGCNSSATATITVNPSPDVSTSTTDAGCNQNDGSASASTTMDFPPYTYAWSNGESGSLIDSLSDGVYYVNVTNGLGCTASKVANVSSTAFTVSVNSVTHVECHGDNTGAIDLTINGNSAGQPYSVEWLNTGSNSTDANNIPAGTWEAYVEDANGCSVTKVIEVTEPDPITWTANSFSASCTGTNGMAECVVMGGTPPYSYQWYDNTGAPLGGEMNDTISGVSPGSYSIQITDDKMCTATWNTTVTSVNGPQISVDTVVNAGCSGTGEIQVTVNSQAGVQSVNWSNGATTEDISGLSPGYYSVEVTDNNGCVGTKGVEVSSGAPPAVNICLVTVDTNTVTNQVVWEKPNSSFIEQFNIYRETATAGQFQLLDSVEYAQESKFTDSVAHPNLRSWRYKISAVSFCGAESPLSPAHKTIHLTENLALGGGVNLIWDEYEGFNYQTYNIYRHTANGWSNLISLPTSSSSITDANAGSFSQLDYFISVDAPNTCTSEKATDHNATRSNRSNYSAGPNGGDDNSLDINEVQQAEVTIYPNPTNGWINLEWSAAQKEVQYRIIDASGKLIRSWQSNKQYERVNLANLEAGLYFITLRNENTKHQYRVIKH